MGDLRGERRGKGERFKKGEGWLGGRRKMKGRMRKKGRRKGVVEEHSLKFSLLELFRVEWPAQSSTLRSSRVVVK